MEEATTEGATTEGATMEVTPIGGRGRYSPARAAAGDGRGSEGERRTAMRGTDLPPENATGAGVLRQQPDPASDRRRRGGGGMAVVARVLLALGAVIGASVGPLAACSAGAGENAGVEDAFRAVRYRMVRDRIEARGIHRESVLDAMRRAPRHLFVPESLRSRAYEDRPLPIGEEQTISQPYVVAFMSALADIEPGDRVLEIGTGSGYQAAVLAEMGAEVWSIELLPGLAATAEAALRGAGYDRIRLRVGNGYLGWPEEAPFDRIIVTAAPPEIPPALLEQLGPDGRLVAPVGEASRIQELVLAYRDEAGEIVIEEHGAVAFVPMVDPRNR